MSLRAAKPKDRGSKRAAMIMMAIKQPTAASQILERLSKETRSSELILDWNAGWPLVTDVTSTQAPTPLRRTTPPFHLPDNLCLFNNMRHCHCSFKEQSQ